MIWLVRLYPRGWRERYGAEFIEIVAGQRPSIGMIIDVLGGALDARLHPQIHVRQTVVTEGDTVTDEMLKRCAAGGPTLSNRDRMAAGIGMLLSSLALATTYVILTKFYHHAPAVEALGCVMLPAILLFYVQMAYLRRRAFTTRVFFTGGMLGTLYLIMWGACVLASQLEPVWRHHR